MPRLLVYTRTTGYRHDSIPAGVAALRSLEGYAVDATEDPAVFRPAQIRDYAAVVFLSTSGDVLDDPGRDTLIGYMAAGGAWLGIHAASTTEYDWPWFRTLAGARFDQHPPVQKGTMTVEDRDHPATRHLSATWTRRDEWYAFRANPRPYVHVLLTVDEASYTGGTMGADHPIAWCHDRVGGRSFYTALGHTEESFTEPAFLGHLSGALSWLTSTSRGAPVPVREHPPSLRKPHISDISPMRTALPAASPGARPPAPGQRVAFQLDFPFCSRENGPFSRSYGPLRNLRMGERA